MARHVEPLSGGLVTIRDIAELEPGQLSYLRNGIYNPGDPALYRAFGRSSFGTVSATAVDVVGLRDIQFDNGNHYLLAVASASAYRAPVGDSGSFTSMASFASVPTQLEVAHYRNRFYLFGGTTVDASAASANGNLVAYLTATAAANTPTTRAHGLLPVVSAPTVTTAAGTFSQTVTGYYEYWTTEVVKYTQDGVVQSVESTFSSDTGPSTVYVSATGIVPTVQMPVPRNPGTTHWRVYRSTKKDLQNDKMFPVGFMVAEIATATGTQADATGGTTTSYFFPTTYQTSGKYAEFTNPSNLGADDAAVASAAVGPTWLDSKQQGVYGFAFSGISGQVIGIEVACEGYVSVGTGPVLLSAKIGKRKSTGDLFVDVDGPGGTNPPEKSGRITSTSAGAPTTITLGSSTDRWVGNNVVGFSASDFDANFMVVLRAQPILPNASHTLSLDYVKVRVTYGAATIQESTIQFPAVSYTFGDVTAQVGKNGPPPTASTGDFYEDTLVTNDKDNPSVIRYSAPGEPDAFPSTYYLDFETRDNDVITLVKTVGERLIVGLGKSIWRVNYLPSERDASFDRGKAKQVISRTNGVINPMCACTFTRDGGQEELAFVSQKGIHSTDGYSFLTRSGNLDWRGMFSTLSTAICLINDPENEKLKFLFQNDSFGNETFMCLEFMYAKGDVDEKGNFKVGGPVHMRNYDSGVADFADLKSAWSVPRSNGDTGIYFGYGGAATAAGAGKVYREVRTFAGQIPAQDPRLTWETRRLFLAGIGNEWRLNEVYGYTGSYTGTPQIDYTVKTTKSNGSGIVTGPSKTVFPGGSLLHRASFSAMCEGLSVSAVVTASAWRQESVSLDYTDYGREDSGR